MAYLLDILVRKKSTSPKITMNPSPHVSGAPIRNGAAEARISVAESEWCPSFSRKALVPYGYEQESCMTFGNGRLAFAYCKSSSGTSEAAS